MADYGTNGNLGDPDWPEAIPERSDDVLVATTEYDDSGAAYRTIDPAGRIDETAYDHAGRVTSKTEDVGGLARTVSYTYTPDGQIATLTAVNSATTDQETRYLYGTLPGSLVMRNDLLRAEIYPDSQDRDGTGTIELGTFDRIEYTYNRQGQQTLRQDQNGTLRSFTYDKLGRLTGDLVTTPGTGIDTQILAISRSYTPLGQPDQVSSRDTADLEAGSIVNQVKLVYNSLGLLVTEYQEHAGAVDMGTSLSVQYGYDDSADTGGELTHGLRSTSVAYPSGRVVAYQYSPDDDDALNRISVIADGASGPALSRYTRLGLGQIVAEEYPQPRLRYDLTHDNFAGLDRFGRVMDHLWRNDRGIFDVVRIRHGYDRAGNRLWREDAVARSMGLDHDEFYAYDSLNQLTGYAHGGLNLQKTAISAPTLRHSWDLDATGNWSRFREDSDGSGVWNVNQTRTHNPANELLTADTWFSPQLDAAGNMMAIPKPSDPSVSLTCVYDAWNRLVSVSDNGVVVGQYSYDGGGRRILKAFDSRSPGDPQGIDTYEHVYLSGDQVIETRRCSTPSPAPWPPAPSFQFVWSLRYIDAPVLRDSDFDADGQCNDDRLYYLNDPNFNIVVLADVTGDIVERYGYSAYGKLLIFNGNWSAIRNTSLFSNAVLYSGCELDVEAGDCHYRSRRYRVDLGRFTARDSIGYRSGLNLYGYVGDDPVNKTDPSGLGPIDALPVFTDPRPESAYCEMKMAYYDWKYSGRQPLPGEIGCLNRVKALIPEPYRCSLWGNRRIMISTAGNVVSAGGGMTVCPLCCSGYRTVYLSLALFVFGCKNCAESLELLMTLVHECSHMNKWNCMGDDEARKNELWVLGINIKNRCFEVVKAGIGCATVAECQATIDQLVKNRKGVIGNPSPK